MDDPSEAQLIGEQLCQNRMLVPAISGQGNRTEISLIFPASEFKGTGLLYRFTVKFQLFFMIYF